MTGFDALVIIAIVASGLLAVVRGFAKEVCSILSILAAFLTALWGIEFLEQATDGALGESALTFALAAAGLFFFGYFLAAFLLGKAVEQIGAGETGTVDRSLGFIFGALRGLILVGLGYAVYSYLKPIDRHGEWIVSAQTYPMVKSTADAISRMAPEQWEPEDDETEETDLAEPAPETADGYERTDRDGLDQLLTTATTSDDAHE